jgi:hypothetical protein
VAKNGNNIPVPLSTVDRAPAQSFGDQLVEVLRDKSIPADKLALVLQTRREILQDQRIEAFHTAFVRMSAEMPQVRKDGTVELIKEGRSLGSYKFATWENMDKVIRPILHKYGFALTFSEVASENGGVILQGELIHVDGFSHKAQTKMPPDTGPGRNALQAHGSALSYAKRYLAEGLCNIVRQGQDDDAIKSGLKPITAEQRKELEQLLKETRTDHDKFMRVMLTGVDKLGDIPARDHPRLLNALNEKKHSRGQK